MGQVTTSAYTSQTIAGYNTTPPPDDGSQSSSNKLEWDKHKTKLADPIKTLSEAVNTAVSNAFAKGVNTDAAVANQLSGSLGFEWATATIDTDTIAAVSSAMAVGTESGATQDTLQEITATGVLTGAKLQIKQRSATEELNVIHATSTAATATNPNIYLGDQANYLIDQREKALSLVFDAQVATATGWYEEARSFIAVPEQDLEFVSSAAITAATTLVVTGLAAGYDYFFQLEAFAPTTDAEVLWMRWSDDGGVTYEADAADYQWHTTVGGTGVFDDSDSEIQLSGTSAFGNDADVTNSFEIKLINPNASSEQTTATWLGYVLSTAVTPSINVAVGGGRFIQGTSAVDAVQFLWSGGSTFKAQGDISVWRRKRS